MSEITVNVHLKEGTKAKDMEVKMTAHSLLIKYKGHSQALIDGQLYDLVKSEDSFWSIEDQRTLIISFDKQNENIWKTIIKGD